MPVTHRLHARCGAAACHDAPDGGASSFVFAGAPRHFERDTPFRVEHLALDLDLDVPRKSVSGTASIHLERLDPEADEVRFDAVAFDLLSVTLDGAPAEHWYDGRTMEVSIPRRAKRPIVAITYRATPRRGLFFLEPDAHVPDRPRQVWSQCQDENARHFVPCIDAPHVKMTTELAVRVPNGWTVLSNGALVAKKTPPKGPWRFHWKMDERHPSYLLSLVAGDFDEAHAVAKRGVPLTYLVPRGRLDDGLRTFARTPVMLEFFGKITGTPYPWNKYAQVVVSDFTFGGMENTTATTMYEHILLDARAAIDVSSDELIAHELAHQWFGDYVTCRDWSEGWLNEGFATFFEHVWREELKGRDDYHVGLKVDLESYLGEASGRYQRPVVCRDYDAPLDLFDRHSYEKGALVLHTLRIELGDTVFWRGVGLYLRRHARGVVTTGNLVRAMEEVSGRSLGKFFEQAIYEPGHPECEVTLSWTKRVLGVSVKQHQAATGKARAAFEFPLTIEIHDAAEKGARGEPPSRRERLLVTETTQTFSVPCARRPAFVVVNPEMRILGDVSLKGPNDMLREQLARAPTARGRWLAAQALATDDAPATTTALAARLADEREMWGVRGECAEALGRVRSPDAFEALARSTGVHHPKVRRAVAAALGRFPTPEAAAALRPLALSDASYVVEAEAARSLGRTREASVFELLLEMAARRSWADLVATGAIDGLAALRDERAIPHLVSWTKYGRPTHVRRAAIRALANVDDSEKTRLALEDLLGDADPHVRIDVARALSEVRGGKSRPALVERLELERDPRARRWMREIVRDMDSKPKQVGLPLKDDVEKLRTEHLELKARLAHVEAQLRGKSAVARRKRR